MISLLVLACMGYECECLFLLLSSAWVFPGVIVVFSLAFTFPNNLVVMGLSCFSRSGLSDGFRN